MGDFFPVFFVTIFTFISQNEKKKKKGEWRKVITAWALINVCGWENILEKVSS